MSGQFLTLTRLLQFFIFCCIFHQRICELADFFSLQLVFYFFKWRRALFFFDSYFLFLIILICQFSTRELVSWLLVVCIIFLSNSLNFLINTHICCQARAPASTKTKTKTKTKMQSHFFGRVACLISFQPSN